MLRGIMYLDILWFLYGFSSSLFLRNVDFRGESFMCDFRERALAVLGGGKPDRLPWFADLSWWTAARKAKGELDSAYDGPEGLVRLHERLHTGLYLPLVWPYRVQVDCPLKIERTPDREIYRYTTPRGTLTEVHRIMREAHTWSYEERLVKSAGDLPAFRYYIEAHRFTADTAEADRLDVLYGPHGLPVVWVPRTPLSRFIVEFAGIESAVFALLEAPEEMISLFNLMRGLDDLPYEAACATRCDLVMIADNLSSEIVTPRYFRDYSLDYYRYRTDQIRKAGKISLAHIDGTLSGLLPILNESGLDCAEGLTPAPVGDVKPEDLRRTAGPGMKLWGGIPGALFSPACSEENFAAYVRRYVAIAREDGAMILGVGDQVPPEADLERVRFVGELCERPDL